MSKTIIDIIYGDAVRTSDERDKLVKANKESVSMTAAAFTAFWTVNYLPFRECLHTAWELRIMGYAPVRHIPWTAARRLAAECQEHTSYVRYEPWKAVLEDLVCLLT